MSLDIEHIQLEGAEQHFIYDRTVSKNTHGPVNKFSNHLFNYVKRELGISYEISQRRKNAKAINSEKDSEHQALYDVVKIDRIEQLYDFYVDTLLSFIQ